MEGLEVAFPVGGSRSDEIAQRAPTEAELHTKTGRKRVLSLEFRPVLVGDDLRRVMMLATDLTERRALERSVRESREIHERQVAALRNLVAGGGALLVNVLTRAKERLHECHELLTPGASGGLNVRQVVDNLFQHVHSIRAEARTYDLLTLEQAVHRLEDRLAIHRGRQREGQSLDLAALHEEFIPLLTELEDALEQSRQLLVEASPIGAAILQQVTVRREDLDRALELGRTRDPELRSALSKLASRPFGEHLLGVSVALPKWAEALGKRAELVVEGREIPVPLELSQLLPDALTHLVRNCLAHGLESADERQHKGKPMVGTIIAECVATGLGPSIEVRDDGAGLDSEHLSAALRALGADPNLNPYEAVFLPGLSSSTGDALSLAGRGVGLAAVRQDLARIGYALCAGPAPEGGFCVRLECKPVGSLPG
jgi:chemotaxis protein histidine kinase CheA